MSSPAPPLDFDTWLQTGKPAYGIVELPVSSTSSEDDNRKGPSGLDKRSHAEKLLFYFVAQGDVPGTREVLRRYTPTDYNANCKDPNGYDLLCCAVLQGSLEMVRVVLYEILGNFPIDTTEGLAKAVRWKKRELLEEIIEFESKKRKLRGGKSGSIIFRHMAEFGTDATPMMIGAIHGNYDMMEILWSRGERMPFLHYPSCSCYICKSYGENKEGRDIQRINKRVLLLEAMGSLEWLLLKGEKEANWDPLWEAIKMYGVIKRCIKEELEWTYEYTKVLDKVVQVPGTLLKLCRTTEEVQVLLDGSPIYKKGRYGAIRLALESYHKDFIAQAGVQHLLENEFTKGHKLTGVRKLTVAVFFTIFYPVVNIILIFGLLTRTTKRLGYISSPEARFYMSFGSYQTLLAVIFYLCVREAKVVKRWEFLDEREYFCRWILILHILSYTIGTLHLFFRSPSYFWSVTWNRLRVVRGCLFYIVFACWFWEDVLGWRTILRQEEADNISLIPNDIYTLGIYSFCFAVILSVLDIFRYTVLFPCMGKTQTRFGILLRDRGKLLLIYTFIGSVLILLLGTKFAKGKTSWYAFGFAMVMVVDCLIALYLEFTGNSLFGGCKRTDHQRLEYAHQKSSGYWRFCMEDVGLTPPFNLLCFLNCLLPGEDKKAAAKRRREYPYLMRKLSQRYFKLKFNNFK